MKMMRLGAIGMVFAFHCNAHSSAQMTTPPPVAGTVSVEVSEGNCVSQTTTTNPGRNILSLKLSSSKPQIVMLVTPGTQPKVFLQHAQSGTSERWSTSVMLASGSYELISSLGGQKCSLTVN